MTVEPTRAPAESGDNPQLARRRIHRTMLLIAGASVLLCLVTVAFCWQMALVNVRSRLAAMAFSTEYKMAMVNMDRAIFFGGLAGVDRLDALSRDPSIAPDGQALAKKLRDMILRGDHLLLLDMYLKPPYGRAVFPWHIDAFHRAIYEHDRAELHWTMPSEMPER